MALAGPAHGEVLDATTWRHAENLLPPEILRHYERGEYLNKVVEWPASQYNEPQDFKEGSVANRGRFVIGASGTILDKATGKQPSAILGLPFPDVRANDPQAAVEIVWNWFYQFWYFGSGHFETQLNWLNPRALERRSDQDVRFLYYDGVPVAERPANPHNLLTQLLSVSTSPVDLQGTASLAWRFRDATQRDLTWVFVPALRRVRAVSPSNRSDGFLGSDLSPDDGPFFNGKPEDFTWRLVGEREQLRIAEETNLHGISKVDWVQEGTTGFWRGTWPDRPYLGYMDPAWKGIAWAPIAAAVLAKRRFWVVEAIPRDRYYLYGRIELFIDEVTYQGAWNRKFDWKGNLVNTMQVMSYDPIPSTRPDGKVDYGFGGNQSFQCAENVRLGRATLTGIPARRGAHFQSRVRFDPSIFDLDVLSRYGK